MTNWDYIWDEKKKNKLTIDYINELKNKIGLEYNCPLLYNGILDGTEVNKNKNELKLQYYKGLKFTKMRCINIKSTLNIKKFDKILEIGCSSGAISYYSKLNIIGIDPSKFCIDIFNKINLNNTGILWKDTTNIFFPDKSFDYVISCSVFQYYKSDEYCQKVIEECKRISRIGVYILDIYESSSNNNHRTYNKSFFKNLDFKIVVPKFYKDFNYDNHYNALFLHK